MLPLSPSFLTLGYLHLILYSWWKAKLKDEPGTDGPVGLIPAAYVEEVSFSFFFRTLHVSS
jgi:hypothetical protein